MPQQCTKQQMFDKRCSSRGSWDKDAKFAAGSRSAPQLITKSKHSFLYKQKTNTIYAQKSTIVTTHNNNNIMEWPWSSLLIWSTIIFLTSYTLLRRSRKSRSNRLPPGPPGWPVFGHIFNLGTMPHRTVAGLAKEYGPVIWLKLGSVDTMVVQSAKAATELFKHHDLTFVERTITETSRALDYDKSSLALAPYGSYWRTLRRICTVEMLVHKRINESTSTRTRCVSDMLQWLEKESMLVKEDCGVHVAKFVFLATFNLLGNLMLSRDLADPESKVGSEFFEGMMGAMEWGGVPNISDIYPVLKWFDLQGLRRKMERDMGKALGIASVYIKERMKEREAGGRRSKDFLDVLLDYEGTGKDELERMSERDITIFIVEIFLAGSETTSSTIEWALSELLLSPEKMKKVKAEIASVVERNKRFQESDIDNLPYLQAVIKETLRLHAPIPFLVPRKALHDTNFMGYDIPKDTQLFVNAWAIGRDPECWDKPNTFIPERFLDSKIDYKGQHFEFIPFGAGRRMCVGIPLAHRMLHLVLGSLLHEFDWDLDYSVTRETLDMRDKIGIVVRKLEPLKVLLKKSTM